MNGPMTMRRLQGARTIDYFLQSLDAGGAGDAGRNISVLHKGIVSALVPLKTSAQQAVEFNHGGLLAAEPVRSIDGIRVQKVPTAVPTISTILSERIRLLEEPVFWVHEAMLGEEEISSSKPHCQTIDGQLYLMYQGDIRSPDRIAEIIGYSMLSWHFLAFLTEQVHQVRSVSELVEYAQTIVVGAYDGESFLVWERS